MKNILNFLDKWGMRISTLLILIVFLKTCSTNGRIDKIQDNLEVTNSKVDTLAIELRKEMKIEGLKSEKRMIQSTDRKIFDVNRQAEIDKEIKKIDEQVKKMPSCDNGSCMVASTKSESGNPALP